MAHRAGPGDAAHRQRNMPETLPTLRAREPLRGLAYSGGLAFAYRRAAPAG